MTISDAAGPLDVRANGRPVADNGEVIRDALLAGFGIALKSTWDVAPYLRSGELVSVLDSYPRADAVAIWAKYPSRAFVPPKTLAFDFVAAHFGDPPYWDREPAGPAGSQTRGRWPAGTRGQCLPPCAPPCLRFEFTSVCESFCVRC
jgi:hypothetical protein